MAMVVTRPPTWRCSRNREFDSTELERRPPGRCRRTPPCSPAGGHTSWTSSGSAGSIPRCTTLAEFLGARGYSTAGFVANQFFCGHESGLARGFDTYKDFPVNAAEVLRASSLGWMISRVAARVGGELGWWFTGDAAGTVSLDFTRKDARAINREFLDWLASHGERPFFAFLNYFDAHDPYLTPRGATSQCAAVPKSRRIRHAPGLAKTEQAVASTS